MKRVLTFRTREEKNNYYNRRMFEPSWSMATVRSYYDEEKKVYVVIIEE